jgi:hypothetical protein
VSERGNACSDLVIKLNVLSLIILLDSVKSHLINIGDCFLKASIQTCDTMSPVNTLLVV